MARSPKNHLPHKKDEACSSTSAPTRTACSSAIDPRDEELIQLLKERNAQAFVYLSEYAARLEANLWRKFNAYIPQDNLKDVVTDTLIQAFHKGALYKPELSSIPTWLNMLGHYMALKYLRDNEIFATQTLDNLAEIMATRIEQEAVPSEEKPSVRMEAALKQLSPQRAVAIRLHYYEGLSFEQIAQEMGITTVSVRSLLSRARDDLRELLDDA